MGRNDVDEKTLESLRKDHSLVVTLEDLHRLLSDNRLLDEQIVEDILNLL